ncbi:unnamed protein product [Calypogeia fissa]
MRHLMEELHLDVDTVRNEDLLRPSQVVVNVLGCEPFQFLEEDSSSMKTIAEGGLNPSTAVDKWARNRLDKFRAYKGLDTSIMFYDLCANLPRKKAAIITLSDEQTIMSHRCIARDHLRGLQRRVVYYLLCRFAIRGGQELYKLDKCEFQFGCDDGGKFVRTTRPISWAQVHNEGTVIKDVISTATPMECDIPVNLVVPTVEKSETVVKKAKKNENNGESAGNVVHATAFNLVKVPAKASSSDVVDPMDPDMAWMHDIDWESIFHESHLEKSKDGSEEHRGAAMLDYEHIVLSAATIVFRMLD